MENSVHLEIGTKNHVAIVLSCPGQKEALAVPPGPAKGATGKNLEYLLELLSNEYGGEGFARGEILITNSWDQVEYKAKTGRTEATINEIHRKTNLDRLSSELEKIEDVILACGDNAISATLAIKKTNKLKDGVKIVEVPHLGNQALNRISEDKNGIPIISYKSSDAIPKDEERSFAQIKKDNRKLRIGVVAFKLAQDLELV